MARFSRLARVPVKLTDLRTCSSTWTLHNFLILRSSADLFLLQIPRILLNLIVPAQDIEEMFTGTDTSDFVGSVRCMATGQFTGVAVELDAENRIFTTLPLIPVQR